MVPWPVTTPSPAMRFWSIPNSVVRCSTKASISTKDPGSNRTSSRSRGALALGPLGVLAILAAAHLREGLPPSQLVDALVARHRADKRGGVSLRLRGHRAGRPSLPGTSRQDLELALDELMLRVVLIHDNEGAVRRDVVGPTGDGPLRRGRAHLLADRRALTAVLLDEELDLRVPVPGIQVVELIEEVVEELVVRDEEVHFPLYRRRGRLDVRRQAVEVHVRVHADADDDVVRLPAIHAFGEDSRDLATLVDRVVGVLQAREDPEMPQRLDDRHPGQEAEDPGLRLLRAEDDGSVQPSRRRGPGAALPPFARRLPVGPEDEAFLQVRLEQLLRGLVRRLEDIEVPHGPSHDLSVRVVELADLQRKNRTRGVYFNVPGSRRRPDRGGRLRLRQILAREEAPEHDRDPDELADVQGPGKPEAREGPARRDDHGRDPDPEVEEHAGAPEGVGGDPDQRDAARDREERGIDPDAVRQRRPRDRNGRGEGRGVDGRAGDGDREAGEEDQRIEGEAEARPPVDQQDGTDAEDRDEGRRHEVVRFVGRRSPSVGFREKLREGRDAVQGEAHGPRELEGFSAGDPLVDHEGRKDEAHDRRAERYRCAFRGHRGPRTEAARIKIRDGIQPNPADGSSPQGESWTSSRRTPRADRGWRKATSRPWAPGRGSASINSRPCSRRRRISSRMSRTEKAR